MRCVYCGLADQLKEGKEETLEKVVEEAGEQGVKGGMLDGAKGNIILNK